jgi:hypothetical protein
MFQRTPGDKNPHMLGLLTITDEAERSSKPIISSSSGADDALGEGGDEADLAEGANQRYNSHSR